MQSRAYHMIRTSQLEWGLLFSLLWSGLATSDWNTGRYAC